MSTVTIRLFNWSVIVSRHAVWISPQPLRSCPDCQGHGGWWVDGPYPEMEACGCWYGRREYRIPLRPRSTVADNETPV